MTAPIKPDALCLIVGSPHPSINGLTVTAKVRVMLRALFIFQVPAWRVEAPWILCATPNCQGHVLLEKWLKPLNDPDADLSQDERTSNTLPVYVDASDLEEDGVSGVPERVRDWTC
jgi:hypothetical protein